MTVEAWRARIRTATAGLTGDAYIVAHRAAMQPAPDEIIAAGVRFAASVAPFWNMEKTAQ